MRHNNLLKFTLFFFAYILISCGGSSDSTDTTEPPKSMLSAEPKSLEEAEKTWETNFGVGPISEFELPAEIDNAMAEAGMVVYEAKCTACHKPDKDFIGPAPKGIMERRTPAWVMNMIIDPEGMIANDPIAKQLLIKFNGAPMANQNLTEEEARAVLEYFRTL
jgi:mono/diheme cytochrome c family protein